MTRPICFVVPYMGKWPPWMDIYLKSCAHNPTVNWLFFTDCDQPENAPDNVAFIDMDLHEFNALEA